MEKLVFAVLFVSFFSASAFAVPHFRISSFEISPKEAFLELDDFATIEPVVAVDNIGDPGRAFLKIRVVDSDGSDIALVNASKFVAVSEEFSSAEMDLVSFNVVDSWEPGLYAVYANVYNSSEVLQDSRIRHLNVVLKKTPIPEASLLLLPLVGFSVLAAILLFGKRRD